jgi:hypothetical protein
MKKAKTWFILWLISLVIPTLLVEMCEICTRITYNINGAIHISNMQLLVILVYLSICSLPLVILANQYARREGRKIIKNITFVCIFHHIVCVALLLLQILGVIELNVVL